MAVKLKLTRMGKKKKPFYRIVAIDSRAARDSRYIEQVGHYSPLSDPPDIKLDMERTQYWLKNGAQATDTVRQIINKVTAANS